MQRLDEAGPQPDAVPTAPPEIGVDSIPDAVVVADAATGRIVSVNDAAGELLECEPAALRGRDQMALHPAGRRLDYVEAFERGIDGERVDRLQNGDPLYVQTVEGSRKPVEINAERVEVDGETFVLGVFRDISDQLDRERTLERTTNRLETLLDALPVPVAVVDPDGIVERWNETAEETFGYDADEVVGGEYPLFVDEGEYKELLQHVLRGDALEGYQTVQRAKDGSRLEIELHARPLYHDGALTGVVGASIDRSSRNRRLEQLDVLYRTFRHNLRNQLTVIRGGVEELAVPANDDTGDVAQRVLEATENLATLSERATQIQHDLMEPGHRTKSTTLADTVSTVSSAFDTESTAFRLAVGDCPAEVEIPERVEPAVLSLLQAIQAHDGERSLQVSASANGTYAALSIEAGGQLLPDSDRQLINEGRETELAHGRDLDIAHADLLVRSVGGNLSVGDEASTSAIEVEFPRLDTDD